MLGPIALLLLSVASAQDPFVDTAEPADVAAPEPQGCWGTAQFAVPDQGDTDVPTDISPRFLLNGACEGPIVVELTDDAGGEVPVALESIVHINQTSFIVYPERELAANTGYALDITSDFGEQARLSFRTGASPSTDPLALTVTSSDASGWCEGRETMYGMNIRIQSDETGFLGYVATDIDNVRTYVPILTLDDAALVSLIVAPDDDELNLCAHVAALQPDGSLGAWTEVCEPVPETENCRRGGIFGGNGCQRNEAIPTNALLFLPLVLLGLRRKRQPATA